MKMGFKADAAQDDLKLIELKMEHEPLRQWPHILYTQSHEASWDLKCWPEWMMEEEVDTGQVKRIAH